MNGANMRYAYSDVSPLSPFRDRIAVSEGFIVTRILQVSSYDCFSSNREKCKSLFLRIKKAQMNITIH